MIFELLAAASILGLGDATFIWGTSSNQDVVKDSNIENIDDQLTIFISTEPEAEGLTEINLWMNPEDPVKLTWVWHWLTSPKGLRILP